MSDDFDDTKTPPRGKQPGRPLTDSEREVFRIKYESGVPSVGEYDHEDTSPIDLFRREPKRSKDLVTELRRHPEKLIPFLGEFAEWVHAKMRERSSSEQKAVEELRELLSEPPNGATKRLQEQVTGLEQAMSELAERLDDAERRAEKAEEKLADINGTINGVRGFSKWAIGGLITAVLGGATGIIATLQAKAKEEGARDERDRAQQGSIDRLNRIEDERAAADRSRRSPRRDYDYDIQPRQEPPKDSK